MGACWAGAANNPTTVAREHRRIDAAYQAGAHKNPGDRLRGNRAVRRRPGPADAWLPVRSACLRRSGAVACSGRVPGYRALSPRVRGDALPFGHDAAVRTAGTIGSDLLELLDALELPSAALVGFDWGGRAACIVAALWPQRVRCLVSSNGYAIQDIAASAKPDSPAREHQLWYQYYFHTERGRAGLAANRGEFCKLLWRHGRPTGILTTRPTSTRPPPSTIRISWTSLFTPTAIGSATLLATPLTST